MWFVTQIFLWIISLVAAVHCQGGGGGGSGAAGGLGNCIVSLKLYQIVTRRIAYILFIIEIISLLEVFE
jgi:hypothetical protein